MARAKKAAVKKNVIKQFGIEKELHAGINPDFIGAAKRVPVFHTRYERNGTSVRFVEFNGLMAPIADDIPRAMWPNNGDEWSADVSRSTVLIKDGPNAWREVVVAASLVEAHAIADGSFWRYGMGKSDAQHDADEAGHMKQFLSEKICKLAKRDIGTSFYPDFNHKFGDRETLCMDYTCMAAFGIGTAAEAIAEVDAEYGAMVEASKRRDKLKAKPRERSPSGKVNFTQQEVCRRAMAVHACEVAHEQAKCDLLRAAGLYKAMHGIDRLDFADEFYQHFSRHALRDRWAAEHELKLARKRLQTATKGYAAMIAEFGHDPFEKLRDRAMTLAGESLPELV